MKPKKYLAQVEKADPGNWRLWFYKGILEELNNPTLYRQKVISSFYYFENAMKFAEEIIITERILPVIDRLKEFLIDKYIKSQGEWWSLYEYYPVFLSEFAKFYAKFEIATPYVKKTSDEWDILIPIAQKRQLEDQKKARADRVKDIEKVLVSMNRYKNRMVACIAESRLYPIRKAKLQNMIKECRFYEEEKKDDLKSRLSYLEKRKTDAEESIDTIKTKAYLLMKRNTESPPARDIWEETFVRVVSDYVEECYIKKDKPDQEDKDELNTKLFPIGFGIDYYIVN